MTSALSAALTHTILCFMSQSAASKEYMFHDSVQGHLGVVETDVRPAFDEFQFG